MGNARLIDQLRRRIAVLEEENKYLIAVFADKQDTNNFQDEFNRQFANAIEDVIRVEVS